MSMHPASLWLVVQRGHVVGTVHADTYAGAILIASANYGRGARVTAPGQP